METFTSYVLYFFIYSFIGYLVEVLNCSIIEKKIVNRGFLFGPILPIYGFGVLAIYCITRPVSDNLAATFFLSMIVCSILEYITSWCMEKLFGIKWWDYSSSDKFNLNGRICLRNCLLFGIAGIIVANQLQPFVETIINLIDPPIRLWFSIILLIILIIDFVASNYAIQKVRCQIALRLISGDRTNEVKRLARSAIVSLLTGKNYLERRIDELKKDIRKKQQIYNKKIHKKLSGIKNSHN